MKKLVIEYVCWGNVVRSATYEAVTRHLAEHDDLAVAPVSSGLHVDVVIPMAGKDVPAVAAIYTHKLIVLAPASNFGTEPSGFGYTLEEHLANVDLAFEQVPQILHHFRTA